MNKDDMFIDLINNRQDKLYRIAFSYVRNQEDALDCLQESLLKGLKNFKKLKNKEYFDTWLIRILINTCNDFLKNRKYDGAYYEENLSESITDDFDETLDLLNSLDKLNPDQREVIYLRYFKDMTYKEVGEVLKIKEGTVKSRLSRGIAKIKENLRIGDKL